MSALRWVWTAALASALAACEPTVGSTGPNFPAHDVSSTDIAVLLSCGGGVPVAHRGTADGWPEPENSLAGLERLASEGVMVAEVDIARAGDGTHFLYHDSQWDDDSTCRGEVAGTPMRVVETCTLERAGRETDDVPPTLREVLDWSRDRIALELDFKPSADYEAVIREVRDAGVERSVILIAYSDGQARRLSRLAPEMWVSVPSGYPEFDPERHLRWFDRDAPQGKGGSVAFHPAADFVVSDRAPDLDRGCP